MFIAGNFIFSLANILNLVLRVFTWLIIIRALISWVNPDPHNPIVQFLNKVTEPILYPIRKMMPFSFRIGIDISPLIAFLLIVFLKTFLVQSLFDLAAKMR
ncbi:MAG: YggT family protein [Candidatus Omnitrophica bacterium]|nr:YggT family protein [Candidatus Omnitrophota bacterium]